MLNQIKSTRVPTRGTDLLRGKDFPKIKTDRMLEIQALLEDVRLFPDNEESIHLLDQIKQESKMHLSKYRDDTFFRSIFEKNFKPSQC